MTDKLSFKVFAILFLLYSLISLQWNWPNLGNDLTPRIFISWAMLVGCSAWCWGQGIYSRKLLLNSTLALLIIPPIGIGLLTLFGATGTKEYYPFLSFFALFFFGLWIIGLIQMDFDDDKWEILGWIITLGSVLLAIIALSSPNYFNFPQFFDLLPVPMTVQQGGFQQRNLFASYLASNISLLYWLVIKNKSVLPKLKQYFLLIFTFILSLTLFCTGSRAGCLGGLLSFLLLLLWSSIYKKSIVRFNLVWATSILLALALSVLIMDSLNPGNSVDNRAHDLIKEIGGASLRLSHWQVSLNIWLDHFWTGVGMGRFTEYYTNYFVALSQQGLKLRYEANLDQPHCELLLWLVETGVIGTLLVLAPYLILIISVVKKDRLYSIGWFAVLIPILLHSFVEFPLHSSGAHWFILGFIFAAGINRDGLTQYSLKFSDFAIKSTRILILSIFSVPVLILFQTAYASKLALLHMLDKEQTYSEHLVKWSQSPEFNHPILGKLTNDIFLMNTIPALLTSGDKVLIKHWTPTVEDFALRWQNNNVWQWLAICYLSNDDDVKLEELQKKLKILNPELQLQIEQVKQNKLKK